MVSKEKITEIKQAVNIVEVIGDVISLTKTGRNFLGLCPFHGEKTPSFNVVEDKQFFHCFGCGKSGDVFKFIEEYQGVSFIESVQLLAEKAGIELEQHSMIKKVARSHPHQVLFDIHTEAGKFYHALLMTTKMGEEARNYLYNRGLTDEDIKHFQLGLAPGEKNYLYQHLSKTFSEEDLLASGLFNPSEQFHIYDAFQGRLMFPLTDENGQIIAFSGRIWQQKDSENKQIAKYKNSRSTVIFNKSYELYHLAQAKSSIKKHQEVYLMEGFMDVIAAHRAGINHVVASMGTALTREHVKHLSAFCKKVIITYDGDRAGRAATAKALEELQNFQVEIVRLPDNLDPDEFLANYSKEKFYYLLANSRISDVEFLIDYLKPENLTNLQMQIDFVSQIAPIIAQHQSIIAQNSYIYKVADLLPDFDYSQIEAAVNHVRLNERAQRSQTLEKTAISQPQKVVLPQAMRISRLVRTENHLLHRMTTHPYLLNEYRLKEDFFFFTPELQTLFDLLKQHGEITSYELAQQTEQVQQAWYRVLEEQLPNEIGPHELEELEKHRQQEQLKRENQKVSRVMHEQLHNGDTDAALEQLAQLIAHKRNME